MRGARGGPLALGRKSTKIYPLDMQISISELLSGSKSSSAALEISSDFGQF
jgi:hypothetical protein